MWSKLTLTQSARERESQRVPRLCRDRRSIVSAKSARFSAAASAAAAVEEMVIYCTFQLCVFFRQLATQQTFFRVVSDWRSPAPGSASQDGDDHNDDDDGKTETYTLPLFSPSSSTLKVCSKNCSPFRFQEEVVVVVDAETVETQQQHNNSRPEQERTSKNSQRLRRSLAAAAAAAAFRPSLQNITIIINITNITS